PAGLRRAARQLAPPKKSRISVHAGGILIGSFLHRARAFWIASMNEVTRILSDLAEGDAHAAGELLPLVYDELRRLAAARMAEEAPATTLNATALVHEAYLRLVEPADAARWENRGHFFAAAALAMRRILVDAARHKRTAKHGGRHHRVDWPDVPAEPEVADEKLLALDAALTRLAAEDPVA